MGRTSPIDNESIKEISQQVQILNSSLGKLNETIVELNRKNQTLQNGFLYLSIIGTILIIVQIMVAINS